MICHEKSRECCEIAKYERSILGIETQYRLKRASEASYEVSVKRGDEEKSVIFYGDFFEIFDLFRSIVTSDTLPENMDGISEDFNLGKNL